MIYNRKHNFQGVMCINKSMSVLHDVCKKLTDKPIQIVLTQLTVMKNIAGQKMQSAKLHM